MPLKLTNFIGYSVLAAGFAAGHASAASLDLMHPWLADSEKRVENKPSPDDYPEFTLKEQMRAMDTLAALRKQQRIDGLREKTRPADWIATAFHGELYDANLDRIEPDTETLMTMQESLFRTLYEQADLDRLYEVYGGDVSELFYAKGLDKQASLAVGIAAVSALLELADEKLRHRYDWRHRLIRREVGRLIKWHDIQINPAIRDLIVRWRIPRDWLFPVPVDNQYVQDCRDQGVPIPPDFPDSRWTSQGTLAFSFIGQVSPTEVFAYKDPHVPGVCIALPRTSGGSYSDGGSVSLLGIICQSETTGKACFWDNIDANGQRITGTDVYLDIDTIKNGSNLAETCTNCHRGKNAFLIHPGTALDLGRSGAPGGPYDTDPSVRYTPIGQAHWSNPGPLAMPTPAAGESACDACHEIADTGYSYCNDVLQPAAQTTMPPFGSPVGWPAPGSDYATHIGFLDGRCP
jgi:hypothetical protein